jgi:tripartite motif-containing protein 71
MGDMNGSQWTAFGSFGNATSQFGYPAGIAIDAMGRIFVADMVNNRIVRMDDMKGGGWTTLARAASPFNHPWGVRVDATTHIYSADMLNNRIVRFVMP